MVRKNVSPRYIRRSYDDFSVSGRRRLSDLREVETTVSQLKEDLDFAYRVGKNIEFKDRFPFELLGLIIGAFTAWQTIPSWPKVGPTLVALQLFGIILIGTRWFSNRKKIQTLDSIFENYGIKTRLDKENRK